MWKADHIKSLISNPKYYLQKNFNHFVKKGQVQKFSELLFVDFHYTFIQSFELGTESLFLHFNEKLVTFDGKEKYNS